MIFFGNEQFKIKPQCEHPTFVKGVGYVLCGHCPLCLAKQKKEWITRLNCEFRTKKTGVFLTLTFDDDHIGNTSYFEIQKFIRRYKHFFNLDGKGIKYFGCFEKGDISNRSHYHLLIFGHNPKFVWRNHFLCNEKLAKIWRNGLVKAEWLNSQSIKYVAQYVAKKFDVNKIEFPNKLIKLYNKYSRNDIEFMLNVKQACNCIVEEKETFIFQSKSIGFEYLFNNLKKILEKNVIQLGSKKYPIPKGFLDKLRKIDNVNIVKFFDERKFNYLSQFADLFYNFTSLEEFFYIENAINDLVSLGVNQKLIKYRRDNLYVKDKKERQAVLQIPF